MVQQRKHKTKLYDLNIKPTRTLRSSNKKCHNSNKDHQSTHKLHINSEYFSCIVFIALSAIFTRIITPVTYVTNLSVYGPKTTIRAMICIASIKMKFKVWIVNLIIQIICNFDVKLMNDLILKLWESIFRLDPELGLQGVDINQLYPFFIVKSAGTSKLIAESEWIVQRANK